MILMKNTYPYLLTKTALIVGSICLGTVYAAGIVSPDRGTIQNIINIGEGGGNFFDTARNILWYLLDFARLVLNGVALIAMLYVGFLWITSMGDEEKTSDGKNRIMLVFLGLFIINIPDVIYQIITGSDYRTSGFYNKITGVGDSLGQGGIATSISENAVERCNFFFCPQNFFGSGSSTSVIQFLEMTMLVIAVIMFTWGGFMMFFGSGNEETNDRAKHRLGYGIIVLLVTGFIEMIYRAVFFQSNLTGTANGIIGVLITGAKFFLYFAGPIAIIYIIIGGYYYITSGGNEERTDKGKKILMYTAFATIMLILGYTFLIEIIGLNIF
ncbi:MAG: hypothetical protein WC753_00575 [Candidatus Gracilibacteria bacterium]